MNSGKGPLPGDHVSEARALAWARERYRHLVSAGEAALAPSDQAHCTAWMERVTFTA
jgi:hypothetical protein